MLLFTHSNCLPAGQILHKAKFVNENEATMNVLKKFVGKNKIEGKGWNT
jgi:hypothetical protein